MKAILVILMAAILIGGWMVLPNYQKDKVYALFDSSVSRQCFDYHRDKLKDPETAYLVKEKVSALAETFYITVKAKNGYGAYGSVVLECKQKNGELNESAMFSMKIEELLGR